MTTAIDTAKAAADIRIIYAMERNVTVIAREGLALTGRGIKHRHGRTYDVTNSAMDRLQASYSVMADF